MARDKKCPRCAETLKADAKVCRFCGHEFPEEIAAALGRKMGLGKKVLIGFGGLFGVMVLAQLAHPTQGVGEGTQSASKVDIDPDRKDKDTAAYLAKQAVPAALKDPSSADFGDVWGMSARIACGTVNAKNSFGAMAGQTRFIYDSGRVSFENMGSSGFAYRWNTTCIDSPHTAAPSGAAGFRWGGPPTGSLKQYSPTTDEGLALYVPRAHAGPLEGVPVAESDLSFDHKRFYSADYYIDGEKNRDAIIAALVKKYGTPQQYDEPAGTYVWKWPGSHVSIHVSFQENDGRTTVSYSRDEK